MIRRVAVADPADLRAKGLNDGGGSLFLLSDVACEKALATSFYLRRFILPSTSKKQFPVNNWTNITVGAEGTVLGDLSSG